MKKAIKKSILGSIAVMFCLITAACSGEDDHQTLETDKTLLEFPAGSADREFTITTIGEWSVEAEGLEYAFGPNMGTAEWYTVTPVFGNGNAKVTVTSLEDTKGNTATLRIKYDKKVKTVELKQADE